MCQAIHAAHEAGRTLCTPSGPPPSVVVCSVASEHDLLRTRERLEAHGIATVLFREPDLRDEATALATAPLTRDLRRALSRYPLWKEAAHA
jgi:hypothetical protein